MSSKSTHTKPRSVRVPDDEWTAATRVAAARGETVTDVIRRSLARYVARYDMPVPLAGGDFDGKTPRE